MPGTIGSGTIGGGTLGEPVPIVDTTITGKPLVETRDHVAIFEFVASETPATFEARLDGGAWVTVTSPHQTIELDFGAHVFEVRATAESVTDPIPAVFFWRVVGRRASTAGSRELLDILPGWAQNAPEHKAVTYASARESQLLRSTAEEVRDGMIPATANLITLPLWESLLGLPVNPAGQTEGQRVAAVRAAVLKTPPDPSGLSWEERITKLIGPGWSYVEEEGAGEEQQRIRVTIQASAGSAEFIFARRVIEKERPAAWEIIVESEEGFVLDVSELDEQSFHAN